MTSERGNSNSLSATDMKLFRNPWNQNSVPAALGHRSLRSLEHGRLLQLHKGDAQLRHIDQAWASTVHVFHGPTVDTVIAAMEANHPHLTTRKRCTWKSAGRAIGRNW
ncbi:hypothetical protein [Candidatus Rariloculus sp.]|uniref:hypothetical protein n=1 Tax=Candidatus Rariloculus sp. TaxID=3101265 RepID=UPI003D11B96E